MERYSKILEKFPREIVLLKSFPCAWGKCTFCDYIADNTRDRGEILAVNSVELKKVTGEFGVLEVINSGSCFELPLETLAEIRQIIRDKGIQRLFLEAHWMYRNRLPWMRSFMEIPITFKIGVESFDFDFRERVLRKNAPFQTPEEVASLYDSACLMVGIQGQTREMIRKDIDLLKKHFRHGTVNVFTNNSTDVKRDEELVQWFLEEFSFLKDDPAIELLAVNTDFGVGD